MSERKISLGEFSSERYLSEGRRANISVTSERNFPLRNISLIEIEFFLISERILDFILFERFQFRRKELFSERFFSLREISLTLRDFFLQGDSSLRELFQRKFSL